MHTIYDTVYRWEASKEGVLISPDSHEGFVTHAPHDNTAHTVVSFFLLLAMTR